MKHSVGAPSHSEEDALLRGGAPSGGETDEETADAPKKKTGMLKRMSSMFKKTNKAIDDMPTPAIVEQAEEAVGIDSHKASVHHYTNLCLILLMIVAAGVACWGVYYGIEELTTSSSSSSSSDDDDYTDDTVVTSTDDNSHSYHLDVDDADDGKRDTDKADHGADFLPSGGKHTDDEADVGFGTRRNLRGPTVASRSIAVQNRERRWALPTDLAMALSGTKGNNHQSYGWQAWESDSDRQSRRDAARKSRAALADQKD